MPVRVRRRARRGCRPGGPTTAVAVLVLGALLAACTSDPPEPPPPPVRVTVVHEGTETTVRIQPGRTAGDAVAKAEVQPLDGRLLSAASEEPIRPNGDEHRFEIGGREVPATDPLILPVSIEVIDGTDTTEPTEVVRRPLAPEGLPNSLQYVQFPGRAGVEEVTIGTESDEVVSQKTLTPAVPAHRATGKVLSLTFDDGPSPTYTPEVLEILKAKKVPAVFCTVGTQVDAHPELAQQIVDDGHVLCNHTRSHVEGLDGEPRDLIEAEMSGGRQAIEDAVGQPAPYYRPPGGSLGPAIYEVAAQQDELVLYWSIDPRDWKKPTPEDLVKDVVNQLTPGGIILLHDGGGTRDATVAALPGIIDYARALGYTFVVPLSARPQVG